MIQLYRVHDLTDHNEALLRFKLTQNLEITTKKQDIFIKFGKRSKEVLIVF